MKIKWTGWSILYCIVFILFILLSFNVKSVHAKPDFEEFVGDDSKKGSTLSYVGTNKLFIEPDYPSLERDDLRYDEVFPLEPVAKLIMEYPLGETFKVDYKLYHYTSLIEEGTKTCGRICEIPFPEDHDYAKTILTVKVDVSTVDDPDVIIFSGQNRTGTPHFDIWQIDMEVLNSIKDVDLIQDKYLAVMISLQIDSFIWKSDLSGMINDYIDIVDNVTVDLYIDDELVLNETETIYNYPTVDELKEKVVDTNLPIVERNKAMLRLKEEYKSGKNTINYIGLKPPVGKEGDTVFRVELNAEGDIYEYLYDNNIYSETYKIKRAKDEMYLNVKEIIFRNSNDLTQIVRPKQFGEKQLYMDGAIYTARDFFYAALPFQPDRTSFNYGREIIYTKKQAMMNDLMTGKLSEKAKHLIYKTMYRGSRNRRKNRVKGTKEISYAVTVGNSMPFGDKIPFGLAMDAKYDNVALINGDYLNTKKNFDCTFAHETGHMLVKEYQGEEQFADCVGSSFGDSSSEGWCMDPDNGTSCNRFLFDNKKFVAGANINIWYDVNPTTECHEIWDAPNSTLQVHLNPGSVGWRKPDVMSSSTLPHGCWPQRDPTYLAMMEYILD